jgi:polyphosphate kinase 2 (PPK2 family)
MELNEEQTKKIQSDILDAYEEEWEVEDGDRSYYNRAGVERVMGFCDDEECEDFFTTVPELEKMLVRSKINLLTYWFSISDKDLYVPENY